ncbi:MAG: SDR family oxidoreductase [Proteobacteria bacterium]|nr:SDR family oxidoreductase [Pseudomonadota bacterium]
MKSKKTVLVTGGAGFLGSHLCKRLISQQHRVICLDNFYTGRMDNIAPLLDLPEFEVVEQDVCRPFNIKADVIFHLACPASPVHYQRDPVQTLKTSVLGAIHVLDLAKQLKVPVLFTSTSEVYGDPHVHPQREDYWGNVNCVGPRSCYDEGKRAAETLFMDYHRMHHVDIRIVRIFNTYGPQMCQNDGRVVSNFIVQALRNDPITIYGSGEQSRSFCYVDDQIDGWMRLIDKPKLHTPVNIGNPVEKSMNEIASIILEITGSRSKLVYHPLPIDDPKQRCPDITTAQEELGWEPKVDLLSGLKKTITYFETLLSKTNSEVVS